MKAVSYESKQLNRSKHNSLETSGRANSETKRQNNKEIKRTGKIKKIW